MVLVVLPALIPDIRRTYEVYFSAFDNDEMGRIIMKILFPQTIDEEFKEAHAVGTLQWWHGCDYQYTMKVVDTDTAEIVGMGLGDILVKPRTPEERQYHGAPWLEGERRERAEKILNPLWAMREKLFGAQPHIYCHVMAVDPRHQGRKAAAALCEWVLGISEKMNLPVYFESSPSTVSLYKKVGFELLPETIVHKADVLGTETDIRVPLMVRMPSTANISFERWRSTGYPNLGSQQKILYMGGQEEKIKQQIVTKVVALSETMTGEISP